MSEQVVLITGASRGFGAAAARKIAERGHSVIATMRNPELPRPVAARERGRAAHAGPALREDHQRLIPVGPGSDAVAAAIAGIVQLQQPLALRWQIGEDCLRMIRDRAMTTDEVWESRMRALGWGFRPDEVVD